MIIKLVLGVLLTAFLFAIGVVAVATGYFGAGAFFLAVSALGGLAIRLTMHLMRRENEWPFNR